MRNFESSVSLLVGIPSWSESSSMLCHAPSLMAVKNSSTPKVIVYIVGERLYFSPVEPLVGFTLVGNSVFFYNFFIEN